jgi:hypothetical protein
MDETAIQNEYEGRKGYIVRTRLTKKAHPDFYSRVTSSGTRAQMTLVAFVCNNAALQPLLPQFLLPKKKMVSRRMELQYDALPAPIVAMTETTGWVNSDHMKTILTALRRNVTRFNEDMKIILILDGAGQHISREVISHANRLGIVLLMIPVQLTWLLQPLDVYVFKEFKTTLLQRHLQQRRLNNDGTLSTSDSLSCLTNTILSVLVNKPWDHIFAPLGLNNTSDTLKTSVAAYIPLSSLAIASVDLGVPTQQEFQVMLGRQKQNLATYFCRMGALLMVRAQKRMTEDEKSLVTAKQLRDGGYEDQDDLPGADLDEYSIAMGQFTEDFQPLPRPIAHNTRSQVAKRARVIAASSSQPLHESQYR